MDVSNVVGFDWDAGNWPKCGKHGVSRAEIEQVFINGPAIYAHPGHSIDEQRLRAIGWNDEGRPIYVSFTIRHKQGGDYIRPVSARYMHKREIERYERQGQA
jgi:hypothetical protein